MHFKIEGGEMYIYICIYNIYTKSAEWCYDDIYIYVCDEKSEDHKNLRTRTSVRIYIYSVFKIKIKKTFS